MTKLHIAGLYKSHLLSRILNMGVEFLQGRPENITHLGMEKKLSYQLNHLLLHLVSQQVRLEIPKPLILMSYNFETLVNKVKQDDSAECRRGHTEQEGNSLFEWPHHGHGLNQF